MGLHKHTHSNESGMISGQMVAIVGLSLLVLILGSVAIWAIVNYNDQKSNVDDRVAVAVAQAKNDQATTDDAKYADREKNPMQQFVGPDDYGRLSFDYPKTWSAYVDQDGKSGGDYMAYLNPGAVPPVGNSASEQFALRVTIEQKDYDQVLQSYEARVESGDLHKSVTTSQGKEGARLDGLFSKDIRGAAVIYKARDKTITIQTDADTFKPDFEKLIATIDFNE